MNAFVGEIRAFPYSFAPTGWQPCAGQLLAISQYNALFSILGTSFGGNGTSTFALPNLQGFTIASAGIGTNGVNLIVGEAVGTENVTLQTSEIPLHSHTFNGATGAATTRVGTANTTTYLSNFEKLGGAVRTLVPAYVSVSPNTTLAPTAVTIAGGSIPHPNQSPYLVMGYYIALVGIFPARN